MYSRSKLVRISIKPTCQMLLQTHVPTWRQGGIGFRTSDCYYKTHVCNNVRLCVFYVCTHKYLHDFHLYAGRFLSVRQKLIFQAHPRVRKVLPIQDALIWICPRIKCSSVFSNRSAKFQKLVTKNYRDVQHSTTFANIKNEIAGIRHNSMIRDNIHVTHCCNSLTLDEETGVTATRPIPLLTTDMCVRIYLSSRCAARSLKSTATRTSSGQRI